MVFALNVYIDIIKPEYSKNLKSPLSEKMEDSEFVNYSHEQKNLQTGFTGKNKRERPWAELGDGEGK